MTKRVKVEKGTMFGLFEATGNTKSVPEGKSKRTLHEFICHCYKTFFCRLDAIQKNITKSCGCTNNATGWQERKESWGEDYPYYVLWKCNKKRSGYREIELKIEPGDIKECYLRQGGKCYYTGEFIRMPTDFIDLDVGANIASIDRIDSNKPYTPDNIQLVTKDVNYMKCEMTSDDFIQTACLIARNFGA